MSHFCYIIHWHIFPFTDFSKLKRLSRFLHCRQTLPKYPLRCIYTEQDQTRNLLYETVNLLAHVNPLQLYTRLL